MRILRIGLPLQVRTFSYKSHIEVVRFIVWDNLPARLCRFHFIRATRRKKQRARGHKPMLIEIAAAVSVVAADQASKAFVLSRSWAADSNAGFLSVRKVLMRRGPLMFYFTPWIHVGLWIASIAIAAVLVRAGMIAKTHETPLPSAPPWVEPPAILPIDCGAERLSISSQSADARHSIWPMWQSS